MKQKWVNTLNFKAANSTEDALKAAEFLFKFYTSGNQTLSRLTREQRKLESSQVNNLTALAILRLQLTERTLNICHD